MELQSPVNSSSVQLFTLTKLWCLTVPRVASSLNPTSQDDNEHESINSSITNSS